MSARARLGLFVAVGLLAAGAFAFLVSPHASSQPDGLNRAAIDAGFDSTATDHALVNGPLAGYAVRGVDDDGVSKGVSGLIGVALCFVVGAGVVLVVRRTRKPEEA